ncbi:type II toxin-antitoxin system ParD family antitoxin [Candidatus Aalborgicola defluviihabitans]|jgi:antitoxin ParD1/3/4|uniref:type II toxin-antitoxin system ParD family antitoxin n=1 Tax=Candidatus Aalborgicola defluviihabitans TaxID=3386187 RepID=UPI0029E8A4FD|nr:type II toxin-antitoxin system ParD family antitoxin [Burkholderiales bacterium]MBL0245358.1 type II toxin-antitoxin system ParD family antitoxin [Rhodoferax sp.]
MTRNTSISLGDHFGAFIAQQISQGRYGSASEVVRAGLRQLEEHETQLASLRAALAAGENSGASTNFDVDAFLKTKRHKLAGSVDKSTGNDAASR